MALEFNFNRLSTSITRQNSLLVSFIVIYLLTLIKNIIEVNATFTKQLR